jgi:hypothetical protein
LTADLIALDGKLYTPPCSSNHGNLANLLLCVYPAGDCDTIPFPPPASGHGAEYWTAERWTSALACALFDAREMGNLPADCRAVNLPNGSVFEIDAFVK